MEKTMYGILKTTGICPIMVAPELDFAADAAHAIAEGGLPVCEVLLHRDEDSLNRIKKIALEAPEVTVGAGSVISIRDAEKAWKMYKDVIGYSWNDTMGHKTGILFTDKDGNLWVGNTGVAQMFL